MSELILGIVKHKCSQFFYFFIKSVNKSGAFWPNNFYFQENKKINFEIWKVNFLLQMQWMPFVYKASGNFKVHSRLFYGTGIYLFILLRMRSKTHYNWLRKKERKKERKKKRLASFV